MYQRLSPRLTAHAKELIVGIALVWAVLIVAATGLLQGTARTDLLLSMLVIAASGSVVIVVAGVRAMRG